MSIDHDENRVTTAERYGSATDSSNLRIKEAVSDADYLIAGAWCDDRLGGLLLRLAREAEVARCTHLIAQAEFDRMEREACALEHAASDLLEVAQKPGIGDAERTEAIEEAQGLVARADEMRELAGRQAMSARIMVLIDLKTLPRVKQELYATAVSLLARYGIEWEAPVLASVIGQVIDIHIDPICHHCQGRGSNGGYGMPKVICRKCKGSGRRGHGDIGKDNLQRQFGRELLDDMREAIYAAERGISRRMRRTEEIDPDARAEAERALADRLRDLRTPQAQAD